MESGLAAFEEKAENNLLIMCKEKEKLQEKYIMEEYYKGPRISQSHGPQFLTSLPRVLRIHPELPISPLSPKDTLSSLSLFSSLRGDMDMPLRGVHRCELVYIEVFPRLNELFGISMTRQGDTDASYRFYPLGKYSLSTHNAAGTKSGFTHS